METPTSANRQKHLWATACLGLLLGAGCMSPVVSATNETTGKDALDPHRREYQDKLVKFRVSTPPPEGVAAFYQGRGFSSRATDVIRQNCFVSISILNKSQDVLWLEPDNWRVRSANGAIQRRDREYWQRTWQALGIPLAHQSTFGWTMLPESRDLRPDEPVGGNLVLEATAEPFTLQANFRTGSDGNGPLYTVEFKELKCRKDPSPP